MHENDGEFNDFDDDDVDDSEISFKPIHIPTGETDAQKYYSMYGLTQSRLGQSPSRPLILRENRLSLPELNQCGSSLTGSPPLSPRMQSLTMNVSGMTLDQNARSASSSEQEISSSSGLWTGSASRTKRTGATASPNSNSSKHTPKHYRSQPQLRGSKASPKKQRLSKSTTAIKHRSPERLRNRNSPSRNSPSSRGSPSRSSPCRNGTSRNSPSKSSPKKKSKKSKLVEPKSSNNLDSFIKISQMPIETGVDQSDYVGDLDILGANLENIGPEEYAEWMCKTKRVMPFHCIAHPEICGSSSPDYLSVFMDKTAKTQRWADFNNCSFTLYFRNMTNQWT